MRRLSVNTRNAFDDQQTGAVEVMLLQFEHADLDAPIRLSSDPTERLSTDPITYGTRSTWRGANTVTEPFLFILASFEKPSDTEDAPPACRVVIQHGIEQAAQLLRTVSSRAVAHIAVVMAETPSVVEYEIRDLYVIAAEGDASELIITLSRDPIESESVPMDRFTPNRFPGLFQ